MRESMSRDTSDGWDPTVIDAGSSLKEGWRVAESWSGLHSPTSSWWLRTKLISPNDLILLSCALTCQLFLFHTSEWVTMDIPLAVVWRLNFLLSVLLFHRLYVWDRVLVPTPLVHIQEFRRKVNGLTSYSSCSFGVATAYQPTAQQTLWELSSLFMIP